VNQKSLLKKEQLNRLLRKVEAAGPVSAGPWPTHPSVYEINTWTWLHRLSKEVGQPVTLATVPEDELKRIAEEYGFDGIWLMGVWRRSRRSRHRARSHPQLKTLFEETLPDYRDRDVVGSPYAVASYQVDESLGGNGELRVLRRRLADHGLRLILDFVPNHMAADHPWLDRHPERLVQADSEHLAHAPDDYFRHRTNGKDRVFAHGRDPNFPGWTDTVQLDYRFPKTREAMARCLLEISDHCDGVRCDMAMLPTKSIFLRTWGGQFEPPDAQFWPQAIEKVNQRHPDFLIIGEVYWDMEWELQQQGFDFTYDKRLYDLLLGDDPRGTRLRLNAEIEFQSRLTRFIENHDEERSATAFGPQRARAAAVISMTLPGMRLFHDGQLEGLRQRVPVQLGRQPEEATDQEMAGFYRRLVQALRHPVFHQGDWTPLVPQEEWFGNPTFKNIIAHRWVLRGHRRVVVANLSPEPAQCFLPLNFHGLGGKSWRFDDLVGDAEYSRGGDDLVMRGFYLDLPAYGCHVFDLRLADING